MLAQEELHTAGSGGLSSRKEIEESAAWQRNCMSAHSCCTLELIAAAQVAEAGKPGTAQDYMADEPYSAESKLAGVCTDLVEFEM